MKLHQQVLHEQNIGFYDLILDEIISQGDTNNTVQVLVMSQLTEYFKDGFLPAPGLVPNSNGPTTTVAIESIKNLASTDKVNLALYLKACLKAGECTLHNATMSSSDWIRFVLQRQN